MKNVLVITTILVISLGVVSCEKFLAVDPAYTQDAENYFLTEEDYYNALTGAYDLLQSSFVSVWIGEIASDNTIAGGESANDTEGLHQIDNMTHGAVNNELRSLLRWNYAGLTRANYILEQQTNEDAIEFSGKNHVFAEAKFLMEDGKYIVGREVEKMSKSKYNVVNPDEICDHYGEQYLTLTSFCLEYKKGILRQIENMWW